MNQEPSPYDTVIASSILERGHIEEQTQHIFAQLAEEMNFEDPERLAGFKYQQKDKEIKRLQVQNDKLLEEIHRLRNKMMQEDTSNINFNFLNQGSLLSQSLSSQEEKSKFSFIKEMKAGLQSEEEKYNLKIEQAFTSMYETLLKMKTVNKLKQEIRPDTEGGQSQIEYVRVPKNHYEVLIELYAINLANKSINELQTKLKMEPPPEPPANQPAVNYASIIQHPSRDLASLDAFFKQLAKRAGFERQWEKYHEMNTEEGIRLKRGIGRILGSQQIQIKIREMNNAATENISNSTNISNLRGGDEVMFKVNKLVSYLSFSAAEKKEWERIASRIEEDKLMTPVKLMSYYSTGVVPELSSVFASNLSSLIIFSISEIFNLFSQMFMPSIMGLPSILEFLGKESIMSLAKLLEPQIDNSYIKETKNWIQEKTKAVRIDLEKRVKCWSLRKMSRK